MWGGTKSDRVIDALKEHIIAWYDPKKQGCTNESLAESPILESLVDEKYFPIGDEDIKLNAVCTGTVNNHVAHVSKVAFNADSNSILRTIITGEKGKTLTATIPEFTIKVSSPFDYNFINYISYGLFNGKTFTWQVVVGTTGNGTYTIPSKTVTIEPADAESTPSIYYNRIVIYRTVNDYNLDDLGIKIEYLPTYRRHDLKLVDFKFGGLSGMGSYVTNFAAVKNRCEYEQLGAQHWIVRRVSSHGYIGGNAEPIIVKSTDFTGKGQTVTIRIKGMSIDNGIYVAAGTGNKTFLHNGDNVVTFTDLGETHYYTFHYMYDLTDVEIEILPLYEDALVFNSTVPTWAYDKRNLEMGKELDAEWLNSNTIFIRKYNKQTLQLGSFPILSGTDIAVGDAGEDLTINVPSFIIRIKGLPNGYQVSYGTQGNTGSMSTSRPFKLGSIDKDGIYVVPAFTHTFEPSLEDYQCSSSKLWIDIGKAGIGNVTPGEELDFTIEFLPRYPESTTQMFGKISGIQADRVKCMMMDFTPFGTDQEQWYYTQRNTTYNDFAIINWGRNDGVKDPSKIIAYSKRNKNGTYINGVKNTDKTVLSLLQQRQVVGVNCPNPSPNNIIYVGYDIEPQTMNMPQMRLYSLILFDRELTEEEMKLVMKKLMKYENVDNITFNSTETSLTDVQSEESYEVGDIREYD